MLDIQGLLGACLGPQWALGDIFWTIVSFSVDTQGLLGACLGFQGALGVNFWTIGGFLVDIQWLLGACLGLQGALGVNFWTIGGFLVDIPGLLGACLGLQGALWVNFWTIGAFWLASKGSWVPAWAFRGLWGSILGAPVVRHSNMRSMWRPPRALRKILVFAPGRGLAPGG